MSKAATDAAGLRAVLDAVFETDGMILFEGADAYHRDHLEFGDTAGALAQIAAERAEGRVFVSFAAYDPASGGHLHRTHVPVDPARFHGATDRCSLEGWGLIWLFLRFDETERINVEISVNSEKRALQWAETADRLGPPGAWDWKRVAKHARRAASVLKTHAIAAET